MAQYVGKVIIYGASGALGKECVRHFKDAKWFTIGIGTSSTGSLAHTHILVDKNENIKKQEETVTGELERILGADKVDSLIATAGGWQGGKVNKNFSSTIDALVHSNLYPACISAALGSKFVKENGLIVFFGASSALNPTPDMVAYGMIKNAIHHLVRSMADGNVTCVGILPGILDTPDNRKWIKNVDVNTFTPLNFLAKTFEQWGMNKNKPKNGSLIKLITKNGETTFEFA